MKKQVGAPWIILTILVLAAVIGYQTYKAANPQIVVPAGAAPAKK